MNKSHVVSKATDLSLLHSFKSNYREEIKVCQAKEFYSTDQI